MRGYLLGLVMVGLPLTGPVEARRPDVRWVERPLGREIAALPRDIDRAIASAHVPEVDAARLRRDAAELRRLHARYQRGGIDDRERAELNDRLDRLQRQLQRPADRRRDVIIQSRESE